MATIDDALNSLKGDNLAAVKDQLKDLLTSASNDADSFAKETGQKMVEWLAAKAQGQLSDGELKQLLYSRTQELAQYANTLEIQTSARVQKVVGGLINLVASKVLGTTLV